MSDSYREDLLGDLANPDAVMMHGNQMESANDEVMNGQVTEQQPLLAVTDVSKVYRTSTGDEVPALRDTSFQVRTGEFVSIVGPSGCGKSTLLNICAGLVDPSGGRVRLSGEPVSAGGYGYVFQSPALLQWKTVLDNVLLPAVLLGLPKSEARRTGLELLETVQLSGTEDHYPGELSGGMQQRVAIARALLTDPNILYMDEPFGALDAMTREQLNQQLSELHRKRNKTILFVTHSIGEAVQLSDRVIVFSGSPGSIVDDLAIPVPRGQRRASQYAASLLEIETQIREML